MLTVIIITYLISFVNKKIGTVYKKVPIYFYMNLN